MLVHQPEESLGQVLTNALAKAQSGDLKWREFDFASAWINQSGAAALEPALRSYLANGGSIRGTVGLDFMGTTEEGLRVLIALQTGHPGNAKFFVYKNEWGGSTFHPKVYAFSNSTETLLVVGSNNLTGAGLHTNVECSLCITGQTNEEPIAGALSLLNHWQTPSEVVKQLNEDLLTSLIDLGYVQTEEKRALRQVRDLGGTGQRERRRLFGTMVVGARAGSTKRAPRPAKKASPTAASAQIQESAYFLVRPHRGSQIQVPKQLRTSAFMEPAMAVQSYHDEQLRSILTSTSSGRFNYYYFEAPEVRAVASGTPILRLYWKDDVLWYEVFDATSNAGSRMLDTLVSGRSASPPTTFDSKPGNPGTQSWCFLS